MTLLPCRSSHLASCTLLRLVGKKFAAQPLSPFAHRASTSHSRRMSHISRTMDTRILIISDTHTREPRLHNVKDIDLLIHCGDLTKYSTISEMDEAVSYLDSLPAALKLVIPGNHEVTLDDETHAQLRVRTAALGPTEQQISQTYGWMGLAKALFTQSESLHLLDEGSHQFTLRNGAVLNVYASPWTPRIPSSGTASKSDIPWGFQYELREGSEGGHEFKIPPGTDIAITHGPPRGVLDLVGGKLRAGCPDLFEAVARAQPRLHCFGHIHSSWGAKDVAWTTQLPERPTHFDAIESEGCTQLKTLKEWTDETLEKSKEEGLPDGEDSDGEDSGGEDSEGKDMEICEVDVEGVRGEGKTMFVNAAIEGDLQTPMHPAWLVRMKLPAAQTGE